jgi:hypothetical protein
MDEKAALIILMFGIACGVGGTLILQGIFYDYPENREKKSSILDKTDKIQDEIDQSIGG